jgi:hypothetical protein
MSAKVRTFIDFAVQRLPGLDLIDTDCAVSSAA